VGGRGEETAEKTNGAVAAAGTYAGAVFLAGPWDVFGWEIELIAMSVANQWELSLMDEPRARALVAVVYSSPTTIRRAVYTLCTYICKNIYTCDVYYSCILYIYIITILCIGGTRRRYQCIYIYIHAGVMVLTNERDKNVFRV